MTEHVRRTETPQMGIAAQVFGKTPEAWEAVKDDVIPLVSYARSKRLFRTGDRIDEWAERYFLNPHPDSISVLLKKGDRVIGFSSAHRVYKWSHQEKEVLPSPTKAEIELAVVAQKEQGKGYIGIINGVLEDELRQRGFKEFRIHAYEDYALILERHYGSRVTSSGWVQPYEKALTISLYNQE